MFGLIYFFLSLLVMILIAIGSWRQSRGWLNCGFTAMAATSLLAWYQTIFPEGLTAIFFLGTFATVLVICGFFYAVYSYEFLFAEDE